MGNTPAAGDQELLSQEGIAKSALEVLTIRYVYTMWVAGQEVV